MCVTHIHKFADYFSIVYFYLFLDVRSYLCDTFKYSSYDLYVKESYFMTWNGSNLYCQVRRKSYSRSSVALGPNGKKFRGQS